MASRSLIRWIRQVFRAHGSRGRKPVVNVGRFRPMLEMLEERALPSALFYTVAANSFSDGAGSVTGSGTGTSGNPIVYTTLRGAINAADGNAGSTVTVPAGTYDLTIGSASTIGELQITASMTITGAGAGSTIIKQTIAGDRVFDIDPNTSGNINATISNLSIEGGDDTANSLAGPLQGAGGGGILTGGPLDQLNLTGCAFLGDSTTGSGGAVDVAGGSLSVSDCQFGGTGAGQGNTATGPGGAIEYFSDGNDHDGTSDTMTITGSTFIDNKADHGGAVCVDIANHGVVTNPVISDCDFIGNQATATTDAVGNGGGAISNQSQQTLTVDFCRFSGNTAAGGNGNTLDGMNSTTFSQITADDDWWTSNSGPTSSDFLSTDSLVTVDNHLVLTLSASPTSISVGGTSTITANFDFNNLGTNVSSSDPAAGHTFPALDGGDLGDTSLGVTYGTPVDGSLSNKETNMQSGGTATATFTGTTGGPGSASVTVDGQSASVNITVIAPPTVTSPTDTLGSNGTSATLGGDATAAGGASITARGVVYALTSTNSNPQIGGTGVTEVNDSSGGTGVFTENVTGLTPGTQYTFEAFATNSAGTTYTSPVNFTTLNFPTVTSPTDTVGSNGISATLGGNATATGGAAITTRGVLYALTSTNSNPTLGGTGVTEKDDPSGGTGTFTDGVTGLTPGTQYTFVAFATNSVGTTYTSPVNFTTPSAPTVTSPTDIAIAGTTATLGGDATATGGEPITTRGVLYALTSTNSNPTLGGTGVTEKDDPSGGTGTFTENITGLTSGDQYTFVAFAENSVGVSYTSPVNFTTLSVPTVTSPTDTNITSTSATLGGDATDNGGANITKRGVVYALTSANSNPQIGGTGVTELDDSSISGTGTGIFTVNTVSALTPETSYTFEAFAENSFGTVYTSAASFTTLNVPTITGPTAVPGSNGTTATLGGDATDNGGVNITKRGVVYALTSTNSNPQIGGTGVTELDDSSISGAGTGIFTVNATGLALGTSYTVEAFATNSVGTTYTSAASFTTLNNPTVTTPTAIPGSNGTTATLGGNATDDGGTNITKRGVVFAVTSTNSNPQIGGTGVTELDDSSIIAPGTGIFTVNATGLALGTSYTLEAFVTNSVGTTYSSAATFTTFNNPTVTTPTAIPGTNGTTATLGGNATDDGGENITTRGIVYALTSANSNPQIGGTGVTELDDLSITGTGTGIFNVNASSLTPGASYTFEAFATNGVGTVYTSPVTFTTLNFPTVTSPTDILGSDGMSASLGGDAASDGSATITTRGVLYALTSTNSNPQIGGTGVTEKDDALGGTGTFTENISGLTPGTQYTFVAFATNSVGTTYTSPVTFTTLNVPTVTSPTDTLGADGMSATLGGDATSDGSAKITTRGVLYALTSTNSNPTLGGTGVTEQDDALGGTGTFTESISGLTPGTQYTFVAFATNSVGTTYTSPVTFTTLNFPTVTSPTATAITTNSATLGGDATADGSATITTRGVLYALTSANPNPIIGGTGVTEMDDQSGGTGVFTENVAGLSPLTEYSFVAFATNSVGTTYSPVSTFTTIGIPTATPQTVSLLENAMNFPITLSGIDPDTPPLALSYDHTSPSHGALTGSGSNLFYTPTSNYFGTDSFTFTVNNGFATSTEVTVSLEIGAPPTVTLNPSSQTISLAGTATFTAAASDGFPVPTTVQWQVSTDGGQTYTNLSNGGNYSNVTTTTLTVSGAYTNLSSDLYRAVFGNSANLTAATTGAELIVTSADAYLGYIHAYDTLYYAASEYNATGNSYAYLAYANASAAFYYAYYAYYYNSIGQQSLANTEAFYAEYYSFNAAYYASYTYAITGDTNAYDGWAYGFTTFVNEFDVLAGD